MTPPSKVALNPFVHRLDLFLTFETQAYFSLGSLIGSGSPLLRAWILFS